MSPVKRIYFPIEFRNGCAKSSSLQNIAEEDKVSSPHSSRRSIIKYIGSVGEPIKKVCDPLVDNFPLRL